MWVSAYSLWREAPQLSSDFLPSFATHFQQVYHVKPFFHFLSPISSLLWTTANDPLLAFLLSRLSLPKPFLLSSSCSFWYRFHHVTHLHSFDFLLSTFRRNSQLLSVSSSFPFPTFHDSPTHVHLQVSYSGTFCYSPYIFMLPTICSPQSSQDSVSPILFLVKSYLSSQSQTNVTISVKSFLMFMLEFLWPPFAQHLF